MTLDEFDALPSEVRAVYLELCGLAHQLADHPSDNVRSVCVLILARAQRVITTEGLIATADNQRREVIADWLQVTEQAFTKVFMKSRQLGISR